MTDTEAQLLRETVLKKIDEAKALLESAAKDLCPHREFCPQRYQVEDSVDYVHNTHCSLRDSMI